MGKTFSSCSHTNLLCETPPDEREDIRLDFLRTELIIAPTTSATDEYKLIEILSRYPNIRSLETKNVLVRSKSCFLTILKAETKLDRLVLHINEDDHFRVANNFHLTQLIIINRHTLYKTNDNIFNVVRSTEGHLLFFQAENIYLSIYTLKSLGYNTKIQVLNFSNVSIDRDGSNKFKKLLNLTTLTSIRLEVTESNNQRNLLQDNINHFVNTIHLHQYPKLFEISITLPTYKHLDLSNLLNCKTLSYIYLFYTLEFDQDPLGTFLSKSDDFENVFVYLIEYRTRTLHTREKVQALNRISNTLVHAVDLLGKPNIQIWNLQKIQQENYSSRDSLLSIFRENHGSCII